MDPEVWQRIKGTFRTARERPPAERNAFLDDACGNDPQRRAEVEALLAADAQAERFIEPPTRGGEGSPGSNAAGSLSADVWLGRTVGRYRLTRLLGHGGMGMVFAAEQDEPRRTV